MNSNKQQNSRQQTITNANNSHAAPRSLCGAARKRYQHLLRIGLPAEEAKVRAMNPINPVTSSRQGREASQGVRLPVRARLGAPVKRVAVPTPERVPDVCVTVHQAENTQCLHLAILPADYPSELWSEPQMEAVQQSIIDLIRRQELDTMKPKFAGCAFRQGWLSVNCNDGYTVDWLRAIATRLRPWEGASLQVIPESEVPFKRVFMGIFPALQTSSVKYALQLIEEQNDGLAVPHWRMIYRGQTGPHMKLIISIDPHSAEVIRKRGYLLNYGFSSVRFKPMELAK